MGCFLAAAHAEDWPQWRGPNRDGVWHADDTGVSKPIEGATASVLWRQQVGAGWASPVIAQGRVYLFDAFLQKPKAQERITCFDEGTGKELWRHACEVKYPAGCFTPGQENGPTATPIVHGGRVYSMGQMGDAFCFDAATGAIVWHHNFKERFKMQDFGINGSPLIDGDLLILAIGGKPDACLLAVNKDTGDVAWHALDEPMTNSSPVIVTAAGKGQLIMWTQQSVSSLDPQSGKLLWSERLITSSDNAISTPVCAGDSLLIGGLMFRLDQDNPGAKVLWPESRTVSHRVLSNTSTGVIHAGCVYSAKSRGELVCLDGSNGSLLWSTDQVTKPKSGACVHLTKDGGSFLLYNDQGELITAELTRQGYHEKSRAFLLAPDQPFGGNKVNWSAPSFANGKVFVRNQKEFVCASVDSKK